jgi:hypothetical protein
MVELINVFNKTNKVPWTVAMVALTGALSIQKITATSQARF